MPFFIEIEEIGNIVHIKQRYVAERDLVPSEDIGVSDWMDLFVQVEDSEIERAINRETIQRLLAEANLTDTERALIDLVYFHETDDFSAIAKQLGFSVRYIHKLHQRALDKLRRAAKRLGVRA